MQYILISLVFFPMAAACLSYLIGRKNKNVRNVFCVCAGLIELALAFLCVTGNVTSGSLPGVCGFGLHFELDGFRRLYVLVIAFMWAMTLLFSPGYFAHYHNRNRYYFFNLMTLGATMGVFLSADLLTTFTFFEVMSFTSYVWVLHEETPDAMRAANTYLAVAVIGGLAALMGIFILGNEFGILTFDSIREAARDTEKTALLYTAGGCILFGFGAKAGMFPLHIWLPKAHPVAPAPASALLSGVLTKSGIFGVLFLSFCLFRDDVPWAVTIAVLGACTMFLGAVLALLSVNLKRTLACSSMSQIGFILVGIAMTGLLGEEGTTAARGVVLYMMNHSLYKLLLFMAAGAVYMNLHRLNLNDIRGFGRNKPLLHLCFLVGGLGLAGIPGTSGYVAKTLIHEGILEAAEHRESMAVALKTLEVFFLASGGMTLTYMTKLYKAVCWERHPQKQTEYDAASGWLPASGRIALIVPMAALILFGLAPYRVLDPIATAATDFLGCGAPEHAVHYFVWENLKGACITVGTASVLYLLVVRKLLMQKDRYVDRLPSWLDLENAVYRPLLLKVLPGILGPAAAVFGENRILTPLFGKTVEGFGHLASLFGENRVLGPVWNGVQRIGAFLLQTVGTLPDTAVWASARTLFRPIRHLDRGTEEDGLTYRAGSVLDAFRPRGVDGEKDHRMANLAVRIRRTIEDTTHLVTGNLSFAMFMMAAGIVFALIYLLFLR